MKTGLLITILAIAGTGCGGTAPSAMPMAGSADRPAAATAVTHDVTAFFDGEQVTVSIIQLSPTASQEIIAKNKNLNLIYEATGFDPVINDLQQAGLHFNPLWQVVDITFTPPSGAHQFTSEADILLAARNGAIRLTFTNVVDVVPVTGSK